MFFDTHSIFFHYLMNMWWVSYVEYFNFLCSVLGLVLLYNLHSMWGVPDSKVNLLSRRWDC